MDWTAGLQAYNKSSLVVSSVSKTLNYNDISLYNCNIHTFRIIIYIIIHSILDRLIKHINNAN